MQYPLNLTFKFFALSPQISVTDATDNFIFYVKQKSFRLKEVITVFHDQERQNPAFTIKADRIIDFSARYNFARPDGEPIGSFKRRGLRSLWRAHYDIFGPDDPDTPIFTIREENPWVKVWDTLFSEIPIVGFFTGYVFNPVYLIQQPEQEPVFMRLEKIPAFLSRKFLIKQLDKADDQTQSVMVLSFLMMLLLERSRG
ncbi:MAG: hypothetical protein AAGG51_16625 [Cyanobacteria bacterium P01_G01_bin.54]